MTSEMERRMQLAVDAANDRIRMCHEQVACPRCGAGVGQRCIPLRGGRPLKHPHRERWTLVQPAR